MDSDSTDGIALVEQLRTVRYDLDTLAVWDNLDSCTVPSKRSGDASHLVCARDSVKDRLLEDSKLDIRLHDPHVEAYSRLFLDS